ncbi:YbjQ family protein [Spartinivicinus ruber]|uniref:YbjQ family protein n=1 Tax=Spartinivicinus ruber TaxID=2683272 RepID=UPI0013D5D370|nr:YbjQ family protein [Spartinivicinus ruber]
MGKAWYGSSRKVFQSFADAARDLGANAVVDVRIWYQPSGWSWAAPHGSGKAVKVIEPFSIDFSQVKGYWH